MEASRKTMADLETREERASAFDLPGGPDAALCLHGLTGTPFEVRYVAERLNATGLRCVGPVMAGHADGPQGLAGVPWTAWMDGARRELFALRGARRVYLVGCSMGALVACALAAEEPARVDGLALLAPALRLKGASWIVQQLCAHTPLPRFLPSIPKLGGSDVHDPEMRRLNPTMEAVPLSAAAELLDLSRHVDALLPGVVAPALVVIGAKDHTVDNSGARRLARRLGSGPSRIVRLSESYHLVGIDVERDRCADEVAKFLQSIR